MQPESSRSDNDEPDPILFAFEDTAIPLPPGTPARYRPDRIVDWSEDAFLEPVLVSFTDTAIPQPPDTPARHLPDLDWSEWDSVDPDNGPDNVDPD